MSAKGHQLPILGIVLIIVSMASLSAMDAVVKVLLDDGMAVLQMIAMRSWFVVPAVGLWMVVASLRSGGGKAVFTTRQPGLHFMRVAVGTGAPLCFFTSLKTLPLPEATTIFFGATFITTALSVPLLKESVGPHRWAAVVVGFLGVLIAMRPGEGMMAVGALYALGASVCYSLFVVVTRKLGPGEGTLRQVFYFHVWLGALATVSLPYVYRPFTDQEIAAIALIAVLVIGGHLCLTRAFILAPVGVVAPFEYAALVWSAIWGFVVWQHIPGPYTVAGAGVIVLSGLYVVHREAKQGRAEASAVPTPAPGVVETGEAEAAERRTP